MKYKVGDKVRIKSREWYEANKDNAGDVALSDGYHFWKGMAIILGCVVEIEQVNPETQCYIIVENNYYIRDEMIEGLATEDQPKPTLFDLVKSSIIEAAKQAPVIVEQTEDGCIKISPIVEEEEDLPIDTPCMVANIDNSIIGVWRLAYYAGKKLCYDCGNSSKDLRGFLTSWNIIIPFDKFNPNDIKESLKHNIVK